LPKNSKSTYVLQISHLRNELVYSKVSKMPVFGAQNILDPLLFLHMYFFIPKVIQNENAEFRKNKK
jgi:hypothetical protein